MELNKSYITNKGRALMAKIGAGTSTYFSRMVVSSQEYADSTASSIFEALTSIPNVKQTVAISDVQVRDQVYIDIKAAVSNKDLKTGYKVGCLGFYAKDPSEGEILYAVTPVKQGTGDWMPSDNGKNASSLEVSLTIQVGNSANVTMNVDANAYATVSMLNEVKEDIKQLQDAVGLTPASVYGVEVDFPNRKFTRLGASANFTPGKNFDSVKPFMRKRCIVADDGAILAYHGESGYTESGKLTQQIEKNGKSYPTGSSVQVMVEQPKYYYRIVPLTLDPIEEGTGFHMRKFRAYISEEPLPGFKVHPAFVRDGEVKEYIYIGAYEGCIYDASAQAYLLEDEQVADFSNDMLSSIANAKPASGLTQNLSRTNSRLIANKRGEGWQIKDAYMAYSTLLLMLIEFNTFDSQTSVGNGVVSFTDDGATNMAVKTGRTSNLGNATGMADGENGKTSISYRGEENCWGNIWEWLDGVNVYRDASNEQHDIYFADHGFVDNTGTDYKKLNATLSQKDGYVSAFCYESDGDNDALFLASETKGASNWGLCDYFYQNGTANKTWLAARLGGCWDNGSNAGAGSLNVYYAASYRTRYIGARVCYVPRGNGEHKDLIES